MKASIVSESPAKYVFTQDKEKLINYLFKTTSTLNNDAIKRLTEYAKELNDIEKYKDK